MSTFVFPPTRTPDDIWLLLQDIVHWACTWSSRFEYVDTLLALQQYDLAQTMCFALQCAADDDDDMVTFDYAAAIKALTATYVACGAPPTTRDQTFPLLILCPVVTNVPTMVPSAIWDLFETSVLPVQNASQES